MGGPSRRRDAEAHFWSLGRTVFCTPLASITLHRSTGFLRPPQAFLCPQTCPAYTATPSRPGGTPGLLGNHHRAQGRPSATWGCGSPQATMAGRGFPQACRVTWPGCADLQISIYEFVLLKLHSFGQFSFECGGLGRTQGHGQRLSTGLCGLHFCVWFLRDGEELSHGTLPFGRASGWRTGPRNCLLPPFLGLCCV